MAFTVVVYQRAPQQGNQGQGQKREDFDPISMSYAETFPTLIQKKLVQTRPPPAIPSTLPWCYKAYHTCAFIKDPPRTTLKTVIC